MREQKVLFVDDEEQILNMLRIAFEKKGYMVRTAGSADAAKEIVTAEKINVAFLDLNMPGMDGFETCKAIRQLHEGKYSQILMVTGLDDTESIEQAFEAGANDFVSKPLNWTMLGHRGKYMLRAGRAFQELNRNKRRLS